jgi:hypothetical protein
MKKRGKSAHKYAEIYENFVVFRTVIGIIRLRIREFLRIEFQSAELLPDALKCFRLFRQ